MCKVDLGDSKGWLGNVAWWVPSFAAVVLFLSIFWLWLLGHEDGPSIWCEPNGIVDFGCLVQT